MPSNNLARAHRRLSGLLIFVSCIFAALFLSLQSLYAAGPWQGWLKMYGCPSGAEIDINYRENSAAYYQNGRREWDYKILNATNLHLHINVRVYLIDPLYSNDYDNAGFEVRPGQESVVYPGIYAAEIDHAIVTLIVDADTGETIYDADSNASGGSGGSSGGGTSGGSGGGSSGGGGTKPNPGITDPPNNPAIPTSQYTFSWNAISGVTTYQLLIGSTRGGSDIFSGQLQHGTQVSVSNLPADRKS